MSDAYTTQRGLPIPCTPRVASKLSSMAMAVSGSPIGGSGVLSGALPDAITSILGVPAVADIRVLYRPAGGALGDGVLVARTTSAVNGSWQVSGLNPALKYDVVARISGYNDMVWSGVSPVSTYVFSVSGSFTIGTDSVSLQSTIAIVGVGPFQVFVSGSQPPGITFVISGSSVVALGKCYAVGSYAWKLNVLDAYQNTVSYDCSVTFTEEADPYWSSVLFLSHFDGADGSTVVIDNSPAPLSITVNGDAKLSSTQKKFGTTSFKPGANGNARVTSSKFWLRDFDFTIESWVYLDSLPAGDRAIAALWNAVGSLSWYFGVGAGGKLFLYYSADGSSGTFTLTTNTGVLAAGAMNRLCVRRLAGMASLWVGTTKLVEQNLGTAKFFDAAAPLSIGSDSGTSLQQLPGYVDELRISAMGRDLSTIYSRPFPNA